MSDFCGQPYRIKVLISSPPRALGAGKVDCPHVEGASGSRCENHVLHVLVRTICFLPLPSLQNVNVQQPLDQGSLNFVLRHFMSCKRVVRGGCISCCCGSLRLSLKGKGCISGARVLHCMIQPRLCVARQSLMREGDLAYCDCVGLLGSSQNAFLANRHYLTIAMAPLLGMSLRQLYRISKAAVARSNALVVYEGLGKYQDQMLVAVKA